MKIIIVRHGDPDNPNNTLTPDGFKEVAALGEFFKDKKFDEVYASPLARAQITTEAILKYHPENTKITKECFKEFDYPVVRPDLNNEISITWDIYPDYITNQKELYDKDSYLDSALLKSGNIKEKYQEVINELDAILAKNGYERNGNLYKVTKENRKTILIVCHFGMMCVLMSHLMNIPYIVLASACICPPSGVTTFITEERKEGIAHFRLNGFGDISHLSIKNISPAFHGRFCETFHSDERH